MDIKYDHLQAEAKAQELWQQENTYAFNTNKASAGPIYTIDTPPPTISGSLHIGHIFSYTQTDIIARYKRMNGYRVFYPFGFDDNGLPTERFVEKQNNIVAHNMSRSEFINLCLKETAKVEEKFEQLWRRIGLSVDWSLCYSTIDTRTRRISQTSFIELYKKNYVYRKDEPALYCTTCRTTVAQADLDAVEKPSTFNDIIFKSGDKELIISTTRPELLPSCVALLYNPQDIRYTNLKDTTATVPLFGRQVPILEDSDVDPEKGSGLVMCCTFGDKTDIAWYKKFKLPYLQSIGLDGKWTDITGPLAGMRVATARQTILELLAKENLLKSQKNITHTVNVHERCKKEIEYLVVPQWFLSILPYKQTFLELAEKINWYPAFMKARYRNWVENLSWDWGLSRQRFYGIPFPVWHCLNCKTIILADIESLPIDPQETPYNKPCPNCASTDIAPDTDVMDTWNTSSLTPYICASLYQDTQEAKQNMGLDIFNSSATKEFMPMSMRPQAHDIIRTWAFYTIVKSWMHQNNIPWHNIVISGHVLSTEKEKISKSQGNSPLAPETLLETYPADAIRYWTASGSLGYDIAFSSSQIGIGQKLLIKLWNAFRFASSYIQDFTYNAQVPAQLDIINEWILHSMSTCYKLYCSYFEQHEFSLALQSIENFFWHDFTDNYIELIKDQLAYPEKYNSEQVYATRWTLYIIGLRILQLYAPFVPHITENIYNLLYKHNIQTPSIHLTQFKLYQADYNFKQSAEDMSYLLDIICQMRKLKSIHHISLKTEIDQLTICSDNNALINLIKKHEALLKGITKALNIEFSPVNTHQTNMSQEKDNWHATVVIQAQELEKNNK